jgi:long-chain fatty acid transport protein
MKKLLSIALICMLASDLFAGGLVTNTNHSSWFTRMQSRDATLGVDAVYYNPAGLTKLGDGLHLSLNNQYIRQTQLITSDYALLTDSPREFEGIVSAPLFPGLYAVYNTGNFAFSFGFNPIGGGGGAQFDQGLPSFESSISELVPLMQSILAPLDAGVLGATGMDPMFRNITGYSADIFFEGSSVYFGYQGNISYSINDLISLGVGVRYVTANNTYKGYIRNVGITASPSIPDLVGSYSPPGEYLRAISGTPYVDPITGATLNGAADMIDMGSNIEADVEQSGSGITPILSLNISPAENLNIALKYEMKTNLELSTKVNDNKGAGIWVDGGKEIADIPAQISAGIMYKPLENLTISTGAHYYLDKNVDYDGSDTIDVEMIDKNFFEYAIGLEYGISESFRVSAGWLTTITGVNENYQSDLSYSLNTNTFGAGFGFDINEMLELSLGASYTLYKDGEISRSSELTGLNYNIGLDKKVLIISAGINIHL